MASNKPGAGIIYSPSSANECNALDTLSADHRDIIRDNCPVCQGQPGECLVKALRAVAGSGRILPD